jgi:hypothetical protein
VLRGIRRTIGERVRRVVGYLPDSNKMSTEAEESSLLEAVIRE